MSWRKTCTSNPNKLHIQYHPTRSTCHKAALTGKKINTVPRHGRFQHLEAFQNKFPARPDHAENTRGISDLLSRVDPGDVRWPKRHHENFHLPAPSPPWRRGADNGDHLVVLGIILASVPYWSLHVCQCVIVSRLYLESVPSRSNPTMSHLLYTEKDISRRCHAPR